MDAMKGPTSNYFSLLDEEERQKMLSKSQQKSTKSEFRPKKVVTQVASTNEIESSRSESETLRSQEDPSSPIIKKEDRKLVRGPKPRQINVTRKARLFDKHSGTGRPPTENKKGGAGVRNWGGISDAIEDGITEEYELTPIQSEQTEEEPKEIMEESASSDVMSLNQYSSKVAEQQRHLLEKYGSLTTRDVDKTWAEGLVVHKKTLEEEGLEEAHEAPKKHQGQRKVVDASEIFQIVDSGYDSGKRKEQKVRDKEEQTIDTNDQSSFPTLTGS